MKNLYIDFDGVIMNTIEITYLELKELNLDFKNIDDQEKVREYYMTIDWKHLLNEKASIINNAMDCIKNIISSNKFNVSILTHILSLDEAVEKVNYIRKYFEDITVIPVPKTISKTKMVHTEGAILIDDYSGNLREWEEEGGIGIKFSIAEEDEEFETISRLDQILNINL